MNHEAMTRNEHVTNGFSHHYQLDESIFILRGVRSDFYFFYLIFRRIVFVQTE